MLSKFSVSNYKSFKNKIEIDFRKGKFDFNHDAISEKTGLVKTAVVYGKNSSGKSNLGLAIFDIVTHLTTNNTVTSQKENLINLDASIKTITFSYEFIFQNKRVNYNYEKDFEGKLIKEVLEIDNNLIVNVDVSKNSHATINLVGTETLIKDNTNFKNISVINYIKNNSILDKRNTNNKIFFEFLDFVDRMLFFRSLKTNDYIGHENGSNEISSDIIKKGKLEDFQLFLNEAGIKCELVPLKTPLNTIIAFKFNKNVREFFSIASTGTASLALFYYWFMRIEHEKNNFFIFIDEFDAFYHTDLSKLIIKKLKEMNKQVVFTTHNTDVMTNDLLRPDCYYILSNGKINQINKCTEKELREGHNLSKLYKAGSFCAK